LLRCLSELAGTLLFLFALAHMPIANLSAVMQSLPLAVTMGAAMFLGEPVGWRRWLAILIGFVGVTIVVRPGFEGFDIYSASALLCVATCAVRDLVTRSIPKHIPSLLVTTATAALVALCGLALIGPLGGWAPLTPAATGAMAVAAMFLVPATIFLILAMRTGEISFVAPYRYTALLWAIALGLIFYSEMPDPAMLAGAALIVGSGLYSLYRETIVGRRKPIADSLVAGIAPDGT
jgi:drug/metabolite transporter (DMT)-like permease